MASVFQFKCCEFTAVGNEVFTMDKNSEANDLQVVCVSGLITIEGKQGTNILGKPVSPISVLPGQAFNFNQIQYEEVKITVTDGSVAQFLANN
jgi:hypothetical protein